MEVHGPDMESGENVCCLLATTIDQVTPCIIEPRLGRRPLVTTKACGDDTEQHLRSFDLAASRTAALLRQKCAIAKTPASQ